MTDVTVTVTLTLEEARQLRCGYLLRDRTPASLWAVYWSGVDKLWAAIERAERERSDG